MVEFENDQVNDPTGLEGLENIQTGTCISCEDLSQTWKKLFFVRKPIFWVEKCPQIQIVPKHIKVPKTAIFFYYITHFLTIMDKLWIIM